MPAFAPVPPIVMRRMMEVYGFVMRDEDEFNWVLFRSATEQIITIPKEGDLVSLTVMMGLLDKLKIDNGTYFRLLKLATDA